MSSIPGFFLENIFLVFISYFLIFLINKRTCSKSAALFFIILTFHHVVAYLYAFYLNRPQNEVDPISFIYLASECTDYGYCGYFGEYLYANFLSKMLALGQSVYFVFLVNILLFVVSLYYFIEISGFFSLNNYSKISIFFYGMWPSVVFFTTLNYREPFELYLLIIGVYFGLTGCRSDSFIRLLACMIALLAMGFFHIKGLIYLSLVLFLILVSYRVPLTPSSLGKKVFLLFLMSVSVYFSQVIYTDYQQQLWEYKNEARVDNNISDATDSNTVKQKERVLSSNELIFKQNKKLYLSEKKYPDANPGYIDTFIRKVTYYRASLSWIVTPQTAFLTTISDRSIPVFIATYFIVYLEFLFSPFFFQVNSSLSFLAYAESVLRLLLFASSLLLVKRYPKLRVLFIIYLAITAMWAIGVVSYGAAIRHHVQSNWILVLLGIPMIYEFISKRLKISK